MLPAAEVVIAENAHGFYCVPRAAVQRPAARKIINGEVWEPETIDFVVRHCVDRSVVHAGAFFGDFLPAVSRALARASSWVHRRAKVPQKAAFPR